MILLFILSVNYVGDIFFFIFVGYLVMWVMRKEFVILRNLNGLNLNFNHLVFIAIMIFIIYYTNDNLFFFLLLWLFLGI